MIYLDNAATTKMSKSAIEAENYVNENFFANSSSIHSFGLKSENLIKETKSTIAKIIGSKDNEVYFTKGASEANNIAISSLSGLDNIAITSKIEHSSVLDSFKNNPYKDIIYLENDKYGFIDIEDLKKNLNDNVSIVSLIYVNNEVGTIQDVKSISKIVKDYNKDIVFHIDATQALGKISCKVDELGVDLMSFSAHKFHGPKSVGALFVREEVLSKIKPVIYGGRQQVVSSGTDNQPGIYAMGVALENFVKNKDYEYIKSLKSYMIDEVEKNIKDNYIISPNENSSPYILDIAFKNVKAEVLVHFLENDEIYVSSGSACSKAKESRILKALGVSDEYIDGAIRFSFNEDISKTDIDFVIDKLKYAIDTIREVI